ncbi:hypothetical protein DXG03_004600 [Asterophora parasitica]|uniref:UDENN domain-containing protein n=1 Tax=Asterophora parasitica TaxID=117018 RepID=A0A9P7G9J0_9AGAR|nr:hypothetical protein DXG03_004600 [Asterophora parasitica]
MASFLPEPSPALVTDIHQFMSHETDDDDADTASQRSISLSSPNTSPRHSALNNLALQNDFRNSGSFSKRESHPYTVDTEFGSDIDNSSMFSRETPDSSAAPSVYDEFKDVDLPTYPPFMPSRDDRASVSSFASGSSRKTRPESLLVNLPNGPIVHGVALVDFNHLIGPRIEYHQGEIFENDEVAKILPFLALPDGAHLTAEDYSYFHLVPPGPNPTTIFGISCNQQISASSLLVKGPDVTRSTVQKAVVVLASKPVFGPIRAKLGVVTTALFNQRDFTDASILNAFATSLELSLRSQLTESGLYMGTKKGLLQTLDDCGSPPLASRAPTLQQSTSLRTSDHKSMMAFMGLPLDIFGKDAFFQPYLPLQQLDVLKETTSWLCGSTNSIVTHQKEIDLLVNIETGFFEFRNPQLERSSALTAADRKWMDDIVTDVNEGWDDQNPTQSLQFKGSDDYLRTKFEEYVAAALSTVKYQDFVAKSEGSGVMITGGSGGDSNSAEDFNLLWISEFRKTNAYEVWNRITDPLIFDIVEPRHPCNEKPSVVADIGLRLQEGIQELKLEQQLAPAREAVSRAVTTGSTNFFKAVEGMRDRWAHRSDPTSTGSSGSSTPVEVSKADLDTTAPSPPTTTGVLRPFSLLSRSSFSSDTTSTQTPAAAQPSTPAPAAALIPPTLTSPSKSLATWGAGFSSFLSSRAPKFSSLSRQASEESSSSTTASPQPPSTETMHIPAPPPEPAPKAKSLPPPVQVIPSEEEEDDSAHNEPPTPQPFNFKSTINVASLSDDAGPPTPRPTVAATPIPVTEVTTSTSRGREVRSVQGGRPAGGLWEDHTDLEVQTDDDEEVEDHREVDHRDDVQEAREVPKGFKPLSLSKRVEETQERSEDVVSQAPKGFKPLSLSRRVETGVKAEKKEEEDAENVVQKVESTKDATHADDAHSTHSRDDDDLEDAYTGLAF